MDGEWRFGPLIYTGEVSLRRPGQSWKGGARLDFFTPKSSPSPCGGLSGAEAPLICGTIHPFPERVSPPQVLIRRFSPKPHP